MGNYNYQINDNNLEIFIKGRIDSSNANLVEEDINNILVDKEKYHLIFNAIGLEYISSAGLRVILKFLKRFQDMEIVDVSMQVYEIFDMTGFTELVKIRKAFRQLDIKGCKIIGEGAKGIVYRYNNDTIIKVYKANDVLPVIQKERELAKKAFVLGIPTAISYDVVMVGDKYGSVFELLDCDSMSSVISKDPSTALENAKGFANLLKQIHETIVETENMNDIMSTLYRWLETSKDYLKGDYNKLKKMVMDIPNTNRMIHGDYHTNNIMMQNGELLLIDMDTLGYGNKIVELAIVDFSYSSMNEFEETNSLKFLGIDKDTAKVFYDEFVRVYFNGLSKDKLERNLKKIRLIAFLRILSRMSKGKNDASKIDLVIEEMKKLTKELDNLILE